ncbi:hypothetical protein RND71_034255 [Anisodus tanguticus]|uniref:Uncharacterized protein n=1 Tax=Anisodus tanguticus TaxID=243964 RepID=A0AAE1RAZ6_9SOLA|nr:hypothetical protein RND71_034255 [Anisodus tanguticus]
MGIWKNAYIAFLASLGVVSDVLELLRWYLKAKQGTTPGALSNDIEQKASPGSIRTRDERTLYFRMKFHVVKNTGTRSKR